MNLDQAIHHLMSGAALERPQSWPEHTYRGFGRGAEGHSYVCDMAQACWESISNGEAFIDNDTVSEAIAGGKPDEIKAVRKAIATRYAEIWLEDMQEQARESQGESEADQMRREYIAERTREVNQDMRQAA